MRTRTPIKTPSLASLTPCADAGALPGTPGEACIQFGGAGRLRPGRQEPLCDSGRTVICPTCSQATAASRLIVPLPRQRLDFRAAHRISRTYSSNPCRSHFEQIRPRSSTSAPAATPADSPGRRRPAIPAQHPSNGDRATVDENDDGNHDHQAIKARWSSLLAPP